VKGQMFTNNPSDLCFCLLQVAKGKQQILTEDSIQMTFMIILHTAKNVHLSKS
jgi:hypothetical protein